MTSWSKFILFVVCTALVLAMVVPVQAQREVLREEALKHAKKALEEPSEAKEAPTEAPEEEYVWLTDEEGSTYRVEALPKEGADVRREGEAKVRYNYRVVYDAVDEDDDFVYVKIYRADGRSFPARIEPTEEDLAAVAATYVSTTPAADTLRLEPYSEGLPSRGQWRNIFDIGDMNGDGHLDILHGPPRKGPAAPVIFLGDGKGNWQPWLQTRFPSGFRMDYGAARAADFNGDGHQDIALGMHLMGVAVLVGDGAGKFESWGEGLDYEIPGKGGKGEAFSSRAIRIVDWNQDGRPDILALGEGPRPSSRGAAGFKVVFADAFDSIIYVNRGDGSWERRTQGNGPGGLFGDHLDSGDFNGDGQLDFVAASSGINRQDILHIGKEDGTWEKTAINLVRPRSYLRAVTAADFNGDGLDDIALSYVGIEIQVWRTGVDILYARKDGGWDRKLLFVEEGRRTVSALNHGDLNGDGAWDLAALAGDGEMMIFLGDGEGFFVREDASEVPIPDGGCRGYHIVVEDLDGDGRDEIVAGFAGEPSALFAPDRCVKNGALTAWKVSTGSADEEPEQDAR